MKIIKWFKAKKLWLRGGILGFLICIALFLYYIFLYFPILESAYGGSLPAWAMILPTLTGHLFPLLSGFIVPYGLFCKFTVPVCTSWSAINETGSTPWTLETGEKGYCLVQTMTPPTACAELSEIIIFFALVLLLLIIYFFIGSIIGWLIHRRRH